MSDGNASPTARLRSRAPWIVLIAVLLAAAVSIAALVAARKSRTAAQHERSRRAAQVVARQHLAAATARLLELRYEEADRSFSRALLTRADLAAARILRAAGFVCRRQYAEAVMELRIAYGTPSPPAVVVRMLAVCSYRLRDKLAARLYFGRCLADQPDSDEARFYEALAQADGARALSLLEALVGERPEYIEARLYRGRLRVGAGRPIAGIADVLEAIRQEPDAPDFWAQLAGHLTAAGSEWAAPACWEEVVRLDPGRADAWEALARLAGGRGEWTRAVEFIGRAAEIEPSRREELRITQATWAREAESHPASTPVLGDRQERWRALLKQVIESYDHQVRCEKLFVARVLAEVHAIGLGESLPAAPAEAEMAATRTVIEQSERWLRSELEKLLGGT